MGVMAAGACAMAWALALSIYDIRERRLPNWLTVPGAVVIVVVAATHGRGASAVLGAAALCAIYLLVHLISPAAMGAGDVKLAIGIGALTASFGSDVWLLAALGAPLLTAGLAVVAMPCQSARTVPHGPSMCLAAAAAAVLAVMQPLRTTTATPTVRFHAWTPELQRILVIDAQAAIGWDGLRRLETPLLEVAHRQAVGEIGRIVDRLAIG